MIYFFAIIGFSNCFFTLLLLIKKIIVRLRHKNKAKKVLKQIDFKLLQEMIDNLPEVVTSRESYDELLNFCKFMIKNFPTSTLKFVNKKLMKNIEKSSMIKLDRLFKTCDVYVNLILNGINSRIQACVNGEFGMTQQGYDDVKAYMLKFERELCIIDTCEESFRNINIE